MLVALWSAKFEGVPSLRCHGTWPGGTKSPFSLKEARVGSILAGGRVVTTLKPVPLPMGRQKSSVHALILHSHVLNSKRQS